MLFKKSKFSLQYYRKVLREALQKSSMMRFMVYFSILYTCMCALYPYVGDVGSLIIMTVLVLVIFSYGCVRQVLLDKRTDRYQLLVGVGVAKFLSFFALGILSLDLWIIDIPLTLVFIIVYWLKFDVSEHTRYLKRGKSPKINDCNLDTEGVQSSSLDFLDDLPARYDSISETFCGLESGDDLSGLMSSLDKLSQEIARGSRCCSDDDFFVKRQDVDIVLTQ